MEYNLKVSLDYLKELGDMIRVKLNLDDDLGFNIDEDPIEVEAYYNRITLQREQVWHLKN